MSATSQSGLSGVQLELLVCPRVPESVLQLNHYLYFILFYTFCYTHTFVSPSAESRGAVVSYRRKYVHEVLVNRLGGISLPRKSVIRLTDSPDMTLDVYRGRKTTTQQQQRSIIGVLH